VLNSTDYVLGTDFTMNDVESRIEELDDMIWDAETKLERKDRKYDRLLDEASTVEAHSRERKLGQAHEVRKTMENMEVLVSDLKDRMAIWRDVRDLVTLLRSGEPEGSEMKIEDVEVEQLMDRLQRKRRNLEDRRDNREDVMKELEAAMEQDREKDRYRHEREEAAARNQIRVLERDDQLREDFEERVEDKPEVEV
jgi:chromosome segregation ATPase